MKWLAPAKINLSLRVIGRRPDGFHDIETLIVPLSLADEIDVSFTRTPAEGNRDFQIDLTCSDPSLPTGRENLAYRAAESFLTKASIGGSVRIELTKRVPHGAGLGGGSSDAATILLALNELCGHPLHQEALLSIAAELGSDVPVFILRGAAICRGRGEVVEAVVFPFTLPLLLLKPEFPVPTPWAYRQWRDSRELPGIRYAAQRLPWGELVNDLERPVFEKYLLLAAMKKWLFDQPEVDGALMSGSGSTVFALLKDDSEVLATALANRARENFGALWTTSCKTVASPATASS